MKQVLLFLIATFLFNGCGIPKSDYDQIVSERDSLILEINKLSAEVEELTYGATRLSALIRKSIDSSDFIKAKEYINMLENKHPDSPDLNDFNKQLPEIEKQVSIQLESIQQQQQDSIRLANINNLGKWEIESFTDNFGNSTNEKYITCGNILGSFSNTATENSDLIAYFIIKDSANIAIKLYEYARNVPVKSIGNKWYIIYIQDNDGVKYELYATNDGSDRMKLKNNISEWKKEKESNSQTMHNILKKGDKIKFVIKEEDNPTTVYRFQIDNADWYDNACIKLNAK